MRRSPLCPTPLLRPAPRSQGHYKFKPSEIPSALIAAGADKEAKDRQGLTALQVSLIIIIARSLSL